MDFFCNMIFGFIVFVMVIMVDYQQFVVGVLYRFNILFDYERGFQVYYLVVDWKQVLMLIFFILMNY